MLILLLLQSHGSYLTVFSLYAKLRQLAMGSRFLNSCENVIDLLILLSERQQISIFLIDHRPNGQSTVKLKRAANGVRLPEL